MEKFFRVFCLGIAMMLGFAANAFAGYTGPELKLPLPSGYSWGVNTVPGSYYTHTGGNYYSIDFDDDIEEDQAGDFGENEVDVLAAASGYATVHAGYSGYGNAVIIDHGNGYSTIYGHLYSFAIMNGLVSQGQVLGKLGNTGNSDGPHVHFQIMFNGDSSSTVSELDGVSVEGVGFNDHLVGHYYLSSNRVISTLTSTAIQAKADELWAIRPSDSGVSCEEYASSGLICHETENMHWWAGLSDSFVIETWTDGTKGEVDLTFDPDNTDQNRAYVVWGGFREMFHQDGHPDEYGPPIGDELDSTFSEYTGYDPYCDQNIGNNNGQIDSWEQSRCIELFCGSSRTYTSMQRFKDATLCWNADTWEAECDPKWPNEHCHEASGLASTPIPLEDDLLVYGSTIYWVQGGSTHGIVSSDMFEACGFSWSDPYPVTEEVFNELPQGDTVHDPVSCGAVVDGTLVDQNGTVYEYWAEDASWHGYPSTLVFDACVNDWSSIQEMSSSVFNTITTGSVVGNSVDCGVLNPGDLVHWNGTVYRITEGSLKRGFTSQEVFNACAYDWDLVTYLTNEEYPVVTTLQDGSAVSSTSDCANITGDLVHWEWTGTVYYLTGTGYKRGITSPEAMTSCGFDWNQVRYVSNNNGAVVWTLGDEANITGNGDCP